MKTILRTALITIISVWSISCQSKSDRYKDYPLEWFVDEQARKEIVDMIEASEELQRYEDTGQYYKQ